MENEEYEKWNDLAGKYRAMQEAQNRQEVAAAMWAHQQRRVSTSISAPKGATTVSGISVGPTSIDWGGTLTMSGTMRSLHDEINILRSELSAAMAALDDANNRLKNALSPSGVLHNSVSRLVSSIDVGTIAARERPTLSFEQVMTKMLASGTEKIGLSFIGNGSNKHTIVGVVVTSGKPRNQGGLSLLLRKEIDIMQAIEIAEDAIVYAVTEKVIKEMEE